METRYVDVPHSPKKFHLLNLLMTIGSLGISYVRSYSGRYSGLGILKDMR